MISIRTPPPRSSVAGALMRSRVLRTANNETRNPVWPHLTNITNNMDGAHHGVALQGPMQKVCLSAGITHDRSPAPEGAQGPMTGPMDEPGLEPGILLLAKQALSHLSYSPGGAPFP